MEDAFIQKLFLTSKLWKPKIYWLIFLNFFFYFTVLFCNLLAFYPNTSFEKLREKLKTNNRKMICPQHRWQTNSNASPKHPPEESLMQFSDVPHRIRWQDSICMVPPPQIQTVKKTTRRVVENIIRRAYVAVSLMDKANVMAPLRPTKAQRKSHVDTWSTSVMKMPIRPSLTCKHHHVLEVRSNLVASSQIEKQWEGIYVSSSSQEHRQLCGSGVKETQERHAEPSELHDAHVPPC